MTSSKDMTKVRGARRVGLAPLEFVLALPLLLFVMALIVNFGWAATWRLRGEFVSRDAVWGARWPRDTQERPPTWPNDATYAVADDVQLSVLDDPAIDYEVVRGPTLGDVVVNPVLDPDRSGAKRGVAEIERTYPVLPSLGKYRSREIANGLVEPQWQCAHEGYQNWFRRSRILYEWPEPDAGLQASYDRAAQTLQSFVEGNWATLRVLEEDVDFIRYQGNAFDFHPRPNTICETDYDLIRDDAVENFLIDYLDSRNEVQLGRITRLPRTMTQSFLSLYNQRKQYLEDLIAQLQMAMPQTAAIQQQINAAQAEIDNELNPKIAQLEAFQKRLSDIESDLKANSPTAM